MKRTWYLSGMLLVAAMTMASCAWAQESLGDLARQQRQGKKPSTTKVITNDDFASSAPVAPPAAADAKAGSAEKAEAASAPEKPKSDKDDKAKLAEGFKRRAEEQKKNIAQLERELDVAQREYRLKVAVYYADVGNNLRDGKKWTEEDKKQRVELEAKQKGITEAKQKLADIQEEARRAGVKVE